MRCRYYQHDGASCHTAKSVNRFLKQEKIEVIKWPVNSPDIAPIENCWGYMEGKMKDKYISSIEKLEHVLKDTWRTTQATKGRCVRRSRNSDRFDEKLTIKTVRYPPQRMVWGFFSYRGKGHLCILPRNETLPAKKYKDLLKEHLVKGLRSHRCRYYQHDGASCHTAKSVNRFLKQEKIEVIKWPVNSPDIAPIENCWGYMEGKMKDKDISSIEKLEHVLKDTWREIPKGYFQSLVKSMPKTLKQLIDKKGRMLKY